MQFENKLSISYIYIYIVLIQVRCTGVQELGCTSKNVNNKACCRVTLPATVIYINKNHKNLCLQESGNLIAHARQPNRPEYAQMLLFLDDLLMFYEVGASLSFNRCGIFVAGAACTSIRYCASIRTYAVHTCIYKILWGKTGNKCTSYGV